jgi:electron transfer flavoprotein alpha subunit
MTAASTSTSAAADASRSAPAAIWVVTLHSDDDVTGRIGDARDLGDRLGNSVAVLAFRTEQTDADAWIHHGADRVHFVIGKTDDQTATVTATEEFWRADPPRLVIASADRVGRAWSARLSARLSWRLVSPALMVQTKGGTLIATALDVSGRRARRVEISGNDPVIFAFRPGVAQRLAPDTARQGQWSVSPLSSATASRATVERIPADPATGDIRHLPRLIAGGRGVGGREGFERLRRVASKLNAGVAASRMAVDLGWIEYARQVGQTGKAVKPDLYIACGISGASHHLEGMSDSGCIVAINTDPKAPLLQRAHLSIVGDLHDVLQHLESELERTT